jgi:hypothetical protein
MLGNCYYILLNKRDRPGLFQSAFAYDNLKQLIPIQGKILIATDFIQDMYVI